MNQLSQEECLLAQAPEVILVNLLLLLLKLCRTFDPRGRRLLQCAASTPNEIGLTINDEVMVTSSWENFKSASTARVLVVLASWSRAWRIRWSEVITELARELRISGDYAGAVSICASALWCSSVVLTSSLRARLFAEIAHGRLLAHERKRDERPAKYALRDAGYALDADNNCAPGHAARASALASFGRHSEACQAYEKAIVARNGLSAVERAVIARALEKEREHTAQAQVVHLELCLALENEQTKKTCAIRSDAPLRSLLDVVENHQQDGEGTHPALFVVTDDYDLPSDFWRSDQKHPRLRNVSYLDPDSTPNRAALLPGRTVKLGEQTTIFCAWPSSSSASNLSSSANTINTTPEHISRQQVDVLEDEDITIASIPPYSLHDAT